MNSTSVNSTTCPLYVDSTTAKIMKTLAYCVMLLLALGGNILLVSVVWTQRKLRTTTNFLISNMALSDLLVPVLAMPRTIVEIHYGLRSWLVSGAFGSVLCKLVYFLQDVSTAVSVLSLSVITIDRFYAVVCPQVKSPIHGRVRVVILGIWLTAMLMHVPYFYTLQLVQFESMTYCFLLWPDSVNKLVASRAFFLTLIILLYFIPLLLIAILQWLIVRRIQRQLLPVFTSSYRRRKRAKRNKSILRFTLAVIILFFLCWSPTVIYSFLILFGDPRVCISEHFRFSSQFLVQSNSAMNFFIYFVFNESYRSIFRGLFCERKSVLNVFRGAGARMGTGTRESTGNPSSPAVIDLQGRLHKAAGKPQVELKKVRSMTYNSEFSFETTPEFSPVSSDTISQASPSGTLWQGLEEYCVTQDRNSHASPDTPAARTRIPQKLGDAMINLHMRNDSSNNSSMTRLEIEHNDVTCNASVMPAGVDNKSYM